MVVVAVAGALAAAPAGAAPVAPLGPDFEWGVATSGFQSEGPPPDSNWTRYVAGGGTHDPYGSGPDFRHRYAEDIERAKQLGVNVFRFSVEWARIEPRPGQVDEAELAYYDDVVRRVVAAGIFCALLFIAILVSIVRFVIAR